MSTRWLRLAGIVFVAVVGFVGLSWTRGQESSPPAVTPPTPPAAKPARDLSKLPPLQKEMYLSAQRAADWLFRVNGADGHFLYGYVPALKTALEGDHYLRQAGAAVALARAARFTGDERYAARARQAVLTLLAETALDSKRSGVRIPVPPLMANRLAAAGLLVLAIHELPAPAADLLEQSDQLCAYIQGRQQADGSLRYDDGAAGGEADGINYYPGAALYGLMRSQQHRPAAAKTEVARKALKFYLPWWQAHKNMDFVPAQAAAYAEAYLLTGKKPFADAVNEMCDWLCELQYPALDPGHPFWGGGFMSWADGKPAATPPQVNSAQYAEALAAACRVARKAGDLGRYPRYREALERCLQFLSRLQYTDANTQHFADWYRPALLGGFYASHQDGNLRIDYTQHALCALVLYLLDVVD
jgi:hypothetical protein